MNWNKLQQSANEILAHGVKQLKDSEKKALDNISLSSFGNYLISGHNLNYIGESKDVTKRIKQHSKEKTSTFYKSYIKAKGKNQAIKQNLKIEDFQVAVISNLLGRKEIEEFGIVNIPCRLNNFQKGKREKFKGTPSKEGWITIQKDYKDLLEEGAEKFRAISLCNWHDLKIESFPGIYWVEHKKDGLIYVGESSNVKERYTTHSGRTYFSAFRRNLGENILGFKLQTIKGKKRYFSESEETKLNAYLSNLKIKTMAVAIGRYELEEYLIETCQPVLNRKGVK